MRHRVVAAVLLVAGCAPDPSVYTLFYAGPQPAAVDGGGGQAGGGAGDGGAGGHGGEAGGAGSGGQGGAGGSAQGGGGAGGEDEPQCHAPEDCPVVPSACRWPTCIEGRCGIETPEPGTPTDEQVDGDCAKNVCDVGGSVRSWYDPTDAPYGVNSCASPRCTRSGVEWTPYDPGVPCEDPGKVCDGAGNCVLLTQGRMTLE
ncbi:hypothetical protein WMF30_10440 [Sorangium sp. So ce134]